MNFAADTFPKERFGLITGSKCSVLFPDKGDGKVGMTTYAKSLANELYWQYYDEVVTWQMEHGNMGEYFAAQHFIEYYNADIVKGEFIEGKENDGGTPDYIFNSYGIDFKCPASMQKWLDYFHVGIDKQQLNQAQMYMYLTGKNLWKVGAYLTETQFMNDNGLKYPVPESKRMIIIDVKRDLAWHDRYKEPNAFVVQKRDEFLKKLKEKFG